MRLLALATTLAAVAVAPQAGAQTIKPKSLTFRCLVEEGPRLSRCVVRDRTKLDPRKVENLRQTVESLPACGITTPTVGQYVDQSWDYVDGPHLLKAPSGQRDFIKNVDWLTRPTPEMVAAAFPPGARGARTGGQAVVYCSVDADGSTRNCRVVREQPTGAGFGAAALSIMAQLRFRPKLRNCSPVDGGIIRVPIVFHPR